MGPTLPIGRTVPANDPDGRVTGSFYVLSGEIESPGLSETMPLRKHGHTVIGFAG